VSPKYDLWNLAYNRHTFATERQETLTIFKIAPVHMAGAGMNGRWLNELVF
jgi:hypothetical protein